MDGVCAEVKVKIRNAIKAKLVELGSYVDDELPEYIMVMVRNKKTKSQMDDDLSLFLGHNTERFTSWLHHVLEKLNAASVLQEQGEAVSTEGKEEEKQVEAPVKKKSKRNDGKVKKEKKHKKKKSKDNSEKKKKKEKHSKEAECVGEKNDSAEKTTVAPQGAPPASPPPPEELKPSDVSVQVNVPCGSVALGSEEADDVLNVRADDEEFGLEADDEIMGASKKRTVVLTSRLENNSKPLLKDSSTSTSGKEVYSYAVTVPTESNQACNKAALSSSNTKEVITSPVSTSSGSSSKKLEARVKPLVSDQSSEGQTSQRIISTVGAVLNRSSEQGLSSDDEAYDPKKPQMGIASKIEVLPRPRRTGSIQPNATLIMKAMADAHKSVNKRQLEETSPEYPVKRKGYLERERSSFSRDKTGMRKIAITVPNASHLEVTTDTHVSRMEVDTAEFESEKMESSDAKEEMVQVKGPLKSAENTKFIVTLKGMKEPAIHSSEESYFRSKFQAKDMHTEEEDEFIEEVEEWEEEEVMSSPAASTASKTRAKIAPPETPMQIDEKLNERCKYWPVCRNGDACHYQHPTKPCQTFPNCKYGDRCRYIHPNCKYDGLCAKPDCPFTHASHRPLVAAASSFSTLRTKMTPSFATTKCRFFPKCTNVNCPYFHPKPCKFGSFCMTANCIFMHPEAATGSKLKWVAPKGTSVETPLQRKPPLSTQPTVQQAVATNLVNPPNLASP